jgi:thymidylate synthase
METKYLSCESFAEAYKNLSSLLVSNYDYETSPRGFKIKERLNQVIKITNPYSNLFYNEKRSPSLKYLKEELKLYFSGNNSLEDFTKASKFWAQLSDDNTTINSAYGYLLFKDLNIHNTTQWNWAKQSLLLDISSRQAILHFNSPKHQKSTADFPCTVYGSFHIRDNKLHFTVCMRSNDCVRGVHFDFPFFMLLMQCMQLELLEKYPNLELGEYTHFVNSLHLYERDYSIIEEALSYGFKEVFIPKITINPILNLENPEFKNSEFGKWLGGV